jgi:hypothetical protein
MRGIIEQLISYLEGAAELADNSARIDTVPALAWFMPG